MSKIEKEIDKLIEQEDVLGGKPYRVWFEDGTSVRVNANNSREARIKGRKEYPEGKVASAECLLPRKGARMLRGIAHR